MSNFKYAFHVLTGFDYVNSFYKRSKIQSFKKMTALIQFQKTPNPNFLEGIDFFLHVIYNRPIT